MTESPYSMFSNFQSIVIKAVKAFLSKPRGEESDKLITTTLRIPNEIKEFYECLSEAETTSLNTAIVSTLVRVKDYTIEEYQQKYLTIRGAFHYQIDSVLKIMEAQKIEFNDLTGLLSWVSGKQVSRSEITSKEKLIDLIDKDAQLKLCKVFGYQYDWLKDNSCPINSKSLYENGHWVHWYKDVKRFIRSILLNFYLDETVEKFTLSFLCSDKEVIRNIISRKFPSDHEEITAIIIADRSINGIKTTTYHCLQPDNINYGKCRSHFIVLVNLLMALVKCRIVGHPSGYFVSSQQHDMILDGKMHISHLFKTNRMTNDFYLDDLEGVQEYPIPDDDKFRTRIPNAYHALDTSLLDSILRFTKKEESTVLVSDELVCKLNVTKVILIKYLDLLEKIDCERAPIVKSQSDQSIIIDLSKLRAISQSISKCKSLDTAFC